MSIFASFSAMPNSFQSANSIKAATGSESAAAASEEISLS